MAEGRQKLLILGAGLSGLTAAYQLRNLYDITILEGRERIGGRIFTKIVNEEHPLTFELGAEWIGKTHTRIKKLCRTLGLSLVNHHLRTYLFYDGNYHKAGQWKFSTRWKKKLQFFMKTFSGLNEATIQEMKDIDWWHFLIANHIPMNDIEILDLIDSTDYGEDVRFVPSYDVLSSYASKLNADIACFYRIDGGNYLLPQKLALAIGKESITLNCEVKEVHQDSNSVSVVCANGRKFHAEKMICTLPAYAVSKIRWFPKLPNVQSMSYSALNYCRIIKTAIIFSKRFWKDDAFELYTDMLPQYIYHATQNQKGKKGILTAYTVGDRSYVLSNMTDETKKNEILQVLKAPFGDVSDYAEDVFSYYWGDDKYTKGAYALFGSNQDESFQERLMKPFHNVYFAGEHVSTVQGFMEGAVESGEHVASALNKVYKSQK